MTRVLSAADRDFWEDNGYVIVHDAVPKENLEAVIDAIWNFLQMDRKRTGPEASLKILGVSSCL